MVFQINTNFIFLSTPPSKLPRKHGCIEQKWVYFNKENPLNFHDSCDSGKTPYNWMLTYHSKADIPDYYGSLIPYTKDKWYVTALYGNV